MTTVTYDGPRKTTSHIIETAMLPPYNPTTGKAYSGGNAEALIEACAKHDFGDPRFATFRQWVAAGRCVMKGEKAAARLCYVADVDNDGDNKDGQEKSKRRLRSFNVFNIEQTAPLEDSDQPSESLAIQPVEKAARAIRHKAKPQSLRNKSEAARRRADDCHAPRLTNTPKRLGQAMHKRLEGDRLYRVADMLNAAADVIESGGDVLRGLQDYNASRLQSAAMEAAAKKTTQAANGYHSYSVETDEWQSETPESVAMRRLLSGAELERQTESERIQAEAELRSSTIPGFFPTPPAVIAVMLEQAGDLRGLSVHEPSCGKGDIIKAALDAGADFVRGYEICPALADYCKRFVHDRIICADVLYVEPGPDLLADVVLMNPPFERDAAPLHVAHALKFATRRLVSVMPSNWADKRNGQALIERMEASGAAWHEVELDAGSFSGAGSFRQTGVSTTILVVNV